MNYSIAIRYLLDQIATVTAIVGDKKYPVTIAQNQGFPAIAFTKSITPIDSKGSPAKMDEVVANITCISDKLDQVDMLSQLIRGYFQNQKAVSIPETSQLVTRIHFLKQLPETYNDELDVYQITSQFLLRIKQQA